MVVRTWGEKPQLPFTAKQHFELGEKLGMLDFERAAKVSGSRFAYLKSGLARLERALASFMLDVHTSKGYVELLPPYLVNRAAMIGTGQLPKFEDDAFKTAGADEYFLIPTAEVPVTNYHQDEILEGALPRYCAWTPCFRAEAGSAGTRHPRAHPPAPVPQGGAGPLLAPRGEHGGAGGADPRRRGDPRAAGAAITG